MVFEQYRQPYPYSYETEGHSPEASYSPVDMDAFQFPGSTVYNHIPFSFCDAPVEYKNVPLNAKFDMVRSPSSNSNQGSVHDIAPHSLTSGSVVSTSSSAAGSPYSEHAHMVQPQEVFPSAAHFYMSGPAIITDDSYGYEFVNTEAFADQESKMSGSYVDPILLSGSQHTYYATNSFGTNPNFSHIPTHSQSTSPAPSPAPSHQSYHTFQPVPVDAYASTRHHQRRFSASSSQKSADSPRPSVCSDEEGGEKLRCTWPDCGKIFKDLKAHMLTHQSVRPMKCPIVKCHYNKKGFARKYDKNRHTLTHYRGTMVCGFCPGSGSPSEKSFNRADTFKRHLTTVHGVEQNPPNARKRSPGAVSTKKLSSYCQDATGKCSTCSATFNNAQEFYEHLDDCVLSVVQQIEPSGTVNEARLAEVDGDVSLQETLDKHMISIKAEEQSPIFYGDEDEDEDEDMGEDDEEESFSRGLARTGKQTGARATIGGGISKKSKSIKQGMTRSAGGGARLAGKGRKRRKHYPPSWGMAADKMNMKKRVLCVFDGARRLLKDDMMLKNDFEVRMALPSGEGYITDLDVETLKRAQGYHDATVEEKGPWIQEQEQDFLSELMA